MKGIAFHWEPPYKDVYSGMDPMADAWTDLAQAFELDLAMICHNFPNPLGFASTAFENLDEFLATIGDDTWAYADFSFDGENADLNEIDWLIIGPAQGWASSIPDAPRYRHPITPGGGWHGLHLAHVICASM